MFRTYAVNGWSRRSAGLTVALVTGALIGGASPAAALQETMPVITTTSPLLLEENRQAVATLMATGGGVNWTTVEPVDGGAEDWSYFELTYGGELTFGSAAGRDYEDPVSTDSDNDYHVTVQASNTVGTARLVLTVRITDVDDAAPEFEEAAVDGDELTITFNDPDSPRGLDSSSVPDKSAFTVSGATVSAVAISGSDVTLTLEAAVAHGATVTVSYTKPGSDPLQDAAENEVASFSGQPVTNNTPAPDMTAPGFSSAVVNGDTLTVTFNEALDPNSVPAGSAFTLSGGQAGTGTATVSDTDVTVTLDTAVAHGATVTVSYTKPGSDPLQDAAENEVASFSNQMVTNNTAATDTTAPMVASAAVDGDTLTVTFDEVLDPNSEPEGTAFAVTVTGPPISLRAGSGTATVSGRKVTVTLDTPVGHGDTVTVSYTKPGSDPLQDAAENEVASFSGQPVTNNTPAPDMTAPGFSSAVVNGDTLTVTFNEALDPNSVPAGSAFTLSGGQAGTGTATVSDTDVTVTLDTAVAHGATVTVSYTKPGSDPLQDAAENEVASFSNQMVTNNTAATDTTAPMVASAAVDGDTLTVTFDEVLDPNSEPEGTAFAVTVTGPPISLRAGSGTATVSGRKVTVTLDTPVGHGDTVTVSYTKPGSDPLQDAAENEVASFSGQPVTNNTPAPDMTAPGFSSAVVNGDTLTVTFNEALDPNSVPAGSAFTLSGGQAGTGTATVSDTDVTVTLDTAVAHGATVTVSYTKPGSDPLQDAAENEVASFSNQMVTNNTPAPGRPGGGSGGGGTGGGGSGGPANSVPVITTAAQQSVAENTTAVVTLAATDANRGDTLTWSKGGGADASAFNLTKSGVLTFASAPNFENPTDADTDNNYVVIVRVSDGTVTRVLALTVTVTNVNEKPATPAAPVVTARPNTSSED